MRMRGSLLSELLSLRKSFHDGSDVSVAIVTIEDKLWELFGEDAVPANHYGDEEDAMITKHAEHHKEATRD